MRNRHAFLFITPIFILLISVLSYADVEWNVAWTFKLNAKPVDVAIALNGKYIFVLTDRGEVLIYTADGIIKDKISVGMQVDSIKATPQEDMLLLSSSKEKTLEVITLDFVQNLNTTGFPYKGPEAAPVVIAVFSDFQ